MLSYEYFPEDINSIVPAPRYPTNAVNANAEADRDGKYNLERKRTSTLV